MSVLGSKPLRFRRVRDGVCLSTTKAEAQIEASQWKTSQRGQREEANKTMCHRLSTFYQSSEHVRSGEVEESSLSVAQVVRVPREKKEG